MKKIVTVIGARPQFVKAAVVSRAIGRHSDLNEVIVHTGQHYDENMSGIFFKEMSIPDPQYNLSISENTHGAMTGKMLIGIEEILFKEKPDAVLVYGDTNSTLAASLAACKLHIPVVHVEAGMRSMDKRIPEEINRIATDHVSSLLMCTTQEPAENLFREGIDESSVHVVGDVMYDAVLFYKQIAKPSALLNDLPERFHLSTIHRQENTNSKTNLESILKALTKLSAELPVVLPLHPRTLKYIKDYGIDTAGIHILPPVGYFDMLYLLERSELVFTDSGGVQREAYYMEKPCVVLRHVTEWKELVEYGVAKLASFDSQAILEAAEQLSELKEFPKNLYGDGTAGDKIVQIMHGFLTKSSS